MYRAWLHRYAVGLAGCTLGLLAAGAGYEIAHRVAAVAVGLLTVGLATALWAVERRAWLRRLGLLAVVAVAASVAHAVLASLFFALTVAIAVFTSRGWMERPEAVAPDGGVPLRVLAVLAAAAILVQIGMGAAMRHGALGLAPHIAAGSAAGILGLWAVWRVLSRHMGHRGLRRSALALLSLGVSQAVLGMGAYLGRAVPAPPRLAVVFSVSHVAAGAAALAAAVTLALYTRRGAASAGEAA